jgi:biopolymer transport protein ExbD
MGKFRKEGKKEVPQVSTSSLPDIVYMLIFFFMITTSMRDVELKVKTAMPKATEIAKLGTESRIQLNDQFARPEDIPDWVLQEREARSEADRPLLTTALKVHKETRMGVVTDVKQELRKVGAFRINYTTLKGSALDN